MPPAPPLEPPRELPPDRAEVLRELLFFLRAPVERDLAPAVLAPEPVDFLLVDARELALADLAREEPVFEPDEAEREPAERFVLALVDLAREADAREPLEPEPSSPLHFPDITRWAASATASAISAPSLVALDIMLLAACEAVSAASRPASRILRRAAGLALIAAAAAASPAASISLLIAALASLSTVVSLLRDFEPDERLAVAEEREELFRADLAIASSPSVGEKTLKGRNGSLMTSSAGESGLCRLSCNCRSTNMLKGTAAQCSGALRHGQRPKVWPFVSS